MNVHSSIFITAKKCKPTEYPSIGAQINKMQYTREYYWEIKSNKILTNAVTFMNLA